MITKKYFLLLMFCIWVLNAEAKQYPKVNFPISGTLLMATGAPLNFSATYPGINLGNVSQLNTSNRITSYQNTIELVLKNSSDFTENAKVTLTADLQYLGIDNSVGSKSITLEINYRSGAVTKSNISGIYAFKNAYNIALTNINTVVTADAGVDINALKIKLKDFIELNIGFLEERTTRINYTNIPSNLGACEDQADDELVIKWSFLPDAEQYELEYTFVDDYTEAYNAPMNPANIPFNFKINSTRVSLKETYYRFPLLYERGWILYRVRAIGKGGTNLDLPVFCKWSGADGGVVNTFPNKYYHNSPHSADKINWQVSSTFAEEGKRSDVVNYFDGTFRSRQTVTGMNLEKQLPFNPLGIFQNSSCLQPGNVKEREVIAAETVYDYQGRPAVNILPSPTNSPKIKYFPLLNISNTTMKPYSWKDFDTRNFTCPNTAALYPKTDASNGLMGASAYYSPNNINLLGFNAFIPDAVKYPFTQLSYLQDNTGRVAAQSGVGPTFKFGNNHETRFYYAAPNQEELDRMFGTEVGDALRYQKNAVMDANRQVSVTYINPEGKTIATALAGKTPDNLDSLPNQATNTIDISLMSKNIINADDKTLITEHQFMVTSDNTDYTFHYSIVPDTVSAEICTGFQVCLDCIYDIDITLNNIESCTGTPLISYSGTIGNLINSSGDTDLTCNNNFTTGNYPRNSIVNLSIGTYVITKKVTVNKQAALAYVAKVFRDTCQAKWNEFLNDELSRVDTMDCYKSCATCTQPPVQTTVCDTAYCKPNPNRCDIIKSMMLADISPGGQYAQFVRNADGTIDATSYPLSIFNTGNILPNHSINFNLLPTTITNINDLVNNWLPEYAEKLLSMHPEYCMIGWCNSDHIDTTLDFDVQILSTQFFSDAVTNGFVTAANTLPNNNITPYEQLLNKDPWFLNSANQIYRAPLLYKLQHYGCATSPTPANELAMQMAYCAHNNPPQNQQGSTPAMNPGGPPCTMPVNYYGTHGFGTGTDQALIDLEWTFLRALYISAKNEVIQASMNNYADVNNCNSRCIGAEHYQNMAPFLSNSVITTQPCGSPWFAWMFYKDKQSRFSAGVDNILNVMADAGIPIDVSGVTDYNNSCQFANTIATQSTPINQAVANTLCGGASDSACIASTAIVDVLNTMIVNLKNSSTYSISSGQVPSSLGNKGITLIVGSHLKDTTLVIAFRPCPTINIPYLKTAAGYVAPTGVCCISNISCAGNTNCSFDIKVLYPNNASKIIHINTKCDFLAGCGNKVKDVCAQSSPYVNAIKEYLNDIFNFKTAYNVNPNSVQLKTFLPSIFQINRGTQINSITLNAIGNFTINLVYIEPKGTLNCTVVLQTNATISNWNNVKNIISITPDFAFAQNGFTKHFIVKMLVGTSMSNLTVITVNGTSSCWDMNECPASKSLCDSLTVLPPYPYANNCVKDLLATAYANAGVRYHSWMDSMKNDLLQRYYKKCLAGVETLNMKYIDKQYQYTLYYYDQAGNLVKTIPPAGVQLLNHAQALQVAASRAAGYTSVVSATHIKRTVYRYNTFNGLMWQKTPDAGESDFFYDGLGRIVASQNAQQKISNLFSYSRYDFLGRLVESGKFISSVTAIKNALSFTNYNNWITFINSQSSRSEITLTHYDDPYSLPVSSKFGAIGQQNLRKRVASVFSFKTKVLLDNQQYAHATHYTYDIEGNVGKLIQDYPNGIIGDKTIDYDFDLQSGKVNKVTYQKGAIDQFIHKYNYDAANRLAWVKTSANGLVWETDAEYKYYRHGPLARLELGTDKVQGLDYMYTLQGWIKGVNGTADTTLTDMGQDGITDPSQTQFVTMDGVTYSMYTLAQLFGSYFFGPGYGTMHNPVARDAFGYVLDYYNDNNYKDYKPINGNTNLASLQQTSGTVKPLFNGNISRMYTQIQTLGNNGYNYTYDQLNRITSQHAWNINSGNMSMLPNDGYGGTLSYDADGNIIKQMRNGKTSAMDNLEYNYYDAASGTYVPSALIPANATNRLSHVKDAVSAGNYPGDIDGTSSSNYQYDFIGNLKSDPSENITQIGWSLQNKILSVTKSTGPSLNFGYDAMGNRVMKEVTNGSAAQNGKTYYVRDATGNVMATYNYKSPASGGASELRFGEANIYGSSRIGIYKPDSLIPVPVMPVNNTTNMVEGYFTANRGDKQYELSNHLGNVLATISDRKIPATATGGITYKADLVSAQDYYAFGMPMPGRNFSSNSYRFGFNGKENDNDVKGDGNQQDYGFRIYDPRLGKFFSVDPLTQDYPELTPYQFASNSPIENIDLDGLEKYKPRNTFYNATKCETFKSSLGSRLLKKTNRFINNTTNYISRSVHQLKPKPKDDFKDDIESKIPTKDDEIPPFKFELLPSEKTKLKKIEVEDPPLKVFKLKKVDEPKQEQNFIDIDGRRYILLPQVEMDVKKNATGKQLMEKIEKSDPGATKGGEHENQRKIDVIEKNN